MKEGAKLIKISYFGYICKNFICKDHRLMKHILGIGNALVDMITSIPGDDVLHHLSLPKGSMTLVDAALAQNITKTTSKFSPKLTSGGSAANTIFGLAHLGLQVGYLGKTGKDELGEIYENDLKACGITTHISKSTTPTGRAVALISPDSERTFAVYLGAALELSPCDIMESILAQYAHVHIEGYQVQNHEVLLKILERAQACGCSISLDLASYNVVEENREFLQYILNNYVNIVFANEEEARALTGEEPIGALDKLSQICPMAIVKIGKNGSMIKTNEKVWKIDAIEANAIDSTGAGDMYASGFLYGLVHHYDIGTSGKIASLVAGKVTEIEGARLPGLVWDEIRQQIQWFIKNSVR